ncbi:MAG: PP2C family protein-serine/threonine phosphatase [Vicinamibacteria bacterium]
MLDSLQPKRSGVPTADPPKPAPAAAPLPAPNDESQAALLRAELERRDAEVAHLRERLAALSQRLDEDVRVAASVQRALLPHPRDLPCLEIASEFLPVQEIGGDYYDVACAGDGRVAFAIGDVMGKGVSAALLASNLKALLRAHLLMPGLGPAEIVTRMNGLFCEVTPRGRFSTFFLGILDTRSGRLEFVNAGHDYPLVVRPDATVCELARGGTVLGLLPDARYESGETTLGPEDRLVLFTDGLSERGNENGELFGAGRLRQAAVASRHDAPRIALYTMLGAIQDFSGGRASEDDATLLVARLKSFTV